jgi:benzoyl-CoA 2,3-dioxygenase component B
MKQDPNEDARAQGGIPLDMVQRYLNLWFALSLDLFGGEISSNAASFFASGLKGRYKEDSYDDHQALDQTYRMVVPKDGRVAEEDVPLRNAMNEVLRDEYIAENVKGVDYWNRECERANIPFRFTYPNKRFNRTVGEYAGGAFHPITGEAMERSEYERRRTEFLPTQADAHYVKSLMRAVTAPGKFADWIAPPLRGINSQPIDFEYVKL